MFRDPENALLPNWKHLPVAYHGRSSSIIASGEPVYRPSGQRKEADGSITFGPTRKLDFELEVGVVICRDSERGKPIAMAEADSYIEGLVLVNDWSARDIQAWEYVPLGPSSARTLPQRWATLWCLWRTWNPSESKGPSRPRAPALFAAHRPLPFRHHLGSLAGDCRWQPHTAHPHQPQAPVLGHPPTARSPHLQWLPVRAGDILASGTISGPDRSSWGCMLELSWNGSWSPSTLENASTSFIEDGDSLISKAGRARMISSVVREKFGIPLCPRPSIRPLQA